MRILAMLTLSGVLLAGCNTIGGFGRDMSAVGEAITDASRDAAKPAPKSKAKSRSAQAQKPAPSGPPGSRQP